MLKFFKKEDDPFNGKEARRNTKNFLSSSGTQDFDLLNARQHDVENIVPQPPVQSVTVKESSKLPEDYVDMTKSELLQLRGILQNQRRSMAFKFSGGGVQGGYKPAADGGSSDYNSLMLGLERLTDLQGMVGSTNERKQLIDTIDYFLEQGKYRR